MTTVRVPGLTWQIRQANDRLQYQADVYNQELIQRLKMVFGHPEYVDTPSYGVISGTDPKTAQPNTNDFLAVSPNASIDFTIDINPGEAVTKSGVWIRLQDHVREISLEDNTIGVANIVYLQYVLGSASPEINDYNESVYPYTTRPGDLQPGEATGVVVDESVQVVVDTVETYLQYTAAVTENYVPIAIVSVQESVDPNTSATTISLEVDHTDVDYSFNRPWFSAQDIEHRSRLGSGTQTENNTHALGLNDLTVGRFSPLQLQTDHGMIVADDVAIPKMPGSQCLTEIVETSIKTDDGLGTYTGYPNAKYVSLDHFPVRLGKIWSATTEVELAAKIVPYTNRVVFSSNDPDNPPAGEGVKMYTLKVEACQPPTGENETTFATNNPTEDELIIAGGLALESLVSTSAGFADAQKFPMLYDMLVDGEGNLIKTPQVVYCYKKLTSLGTSDEFTIDLYGPSRLIVGLINASGIGTMEIDLEVSGTDADGNTITDTFSFDSSWVNPVVPLPPNTSLDENSFSVSTKVFSDLEEISVVTKVDPGDDAAIMIWAALGPYDTYDLLKDACLISTLTWDGVRISAVQDRRIIETKALDLNKFSLGHEAMAMLMNAFAGGNSTVYVEDFRRPEYHAQILPKNFEATLNFALPFSNLTKLYTGEFGFYTTRGLPVEDGAGVEWRVLLTPMGNQRVVPLLDQRLTFHWYESGVGWHSDNMTEVAGIRGMYKHVTTAVPTRIRVSGFLWDVYGMIIFG